MRTRQRMPLMLAFAITVSFGVAQIASEDTAVAQPQRGAKARAKKRVLPARALRKQPVRANQAKLRTGGTMRGRLWSKAVRRNRPKLSTRLSGKIPKTLRRAKQRLSRAGIMRRNMKRASQHIELGMPSGASTQNPEDFLLARNQYVASYSRTRKVPNWVSWHLGAGDVVRGVRAGDFRPDPTIPLKWGRAGNADYKRSGYTRGHLVASGERQGTRRGNSKTFVYSNMIPQIAENNAGPWLHMETFYRDQAANHGKDVYIMAGGVFEGAKKTIGKNRVAVPSATWKIAVIVDKGKGLKDVSGSTRVVSVIVPNVVGKVRQSQPLTDFRVTPMEIEKRTGLSFFAHLPPTVRNTLRKKIDTASIPTKFP